MSSTTVAQANGASGCSRASTRSPSRKRYCFSVRARLTARRGPVGAVKMDLGPCMPGRQGPRRFSIEARARLGAAGAGAGAGAAVSSGAGVAAASAGAGAGATVARARCKAAMCVLPSRVLGKNPPWDLIACVNFWNASLSVRRSAILTQVRGVQSQNAHRTRPPRSPATTNWRRGAPAPSTKLLPTTRPPATVTFSSPSRRFSSHFSGESVFPQRATSAGESVAATTCVLRTRTRSPSVVCRSNHACLFSSTSTLAATPFTDASSRRARCAPAAGTSALRGGGGGGSSRCARRKAARPAAAARSFSARSAARSSSSSSASSRTRVSAHHCATSLVDECSQVSS
mmetsp:Transcript_7686/g.20410  ORF Transcript_7686/g.20410 Transcript_7686/m.20410 type:complete len:344 (-) Transcript_7686:374-1405(-)